MSPRAAYFMSASVGQHGAVAPRSSSQPNSSVRTTHQQGSVKSILRTDSRHGSGRIGGLPPFNQGSENPSIAAQLPAARQVTPGAAIVTTTRPTSQASAVGGPMIARLLKRVVEDEQQGYLTAEDSIYYQRLLQTNPGTALVVAKRLEHHRCAPTNLFEGNSDGTAVPNLVRKSSAREPVRKKPRVVAKSRDVSSSVVSSRSNLFILPWSTRTHLHSVPFCRHKSWSRRLARFRSTWTLS